MAFFWWFGNRQLALFESSWIYSFLSFMYLFLHIIASSTHFQNELWIQFFLSPWCRYAFLAGIFMRGKFCLGVILVVNFSAFTLLSCENLLQYGEFLIFFLFHISQTHDQIFHKIYELNSKSSKTRGIKEV